MRSNREILNSHLAYRPRGEVEKDIEENFDADVVVLDRHRAYHRREGVRESARILAESLPGAEFRYRRVQVSGRVGHLVWEALVDDRRVKGIDSFFIEDGRIKGQTIYYLA